MRSIFFIVVLSFVASLTVSFANAGQRQSEFRPVFNGKQLFDSSKCEKVSKMRELQLCQPLRSEKIHFSGNVIKAHRKNKKTEHFSFVNQ